MHQEERPMKILFYGNQDNTGYRLARWLRHKGHRTQLVLRAQAVDARSRLEWEDQALEGNYPRWAETFVYRKWHRLWPPRQVAEKVAQHDVLLTSGFHIVPALTLDMPVVFKPVGYDLTQMPFKSDRLRDELLSFVYRRRIRRVARILTSHRDCMCAARLLGCAERTREFPMPVDVQEIRREIDQPLLQKITETYAHFDLVFLNLSRKNLDADAVDYKGTDKLLRAFAQILPGSEMKIRIVLGAHGNHVSECKRLVNRLDLNRYVDYVEHLPVQRLHAYLSLKNGIVFDQFGRIAINLGGMARESLALGNIVLGHTNPASPAFKRMYGYGCPILYAHTEEEIADQIRRILAMNRSERDRVRRRSARWAEESLHWEQRVEDLIAILREVCREDRTNGETRDGGNG
jgi:glycosyltransferase involved in cell wall biosynthesis